MTRPAHPLPVDDLAAGLAQARAVRGQWLLGLSSGMLSIGELFDTAETTPALRRITIRQLFLHLPDWGARQTKQAIIIFRRASHTPHRLRDRDLTIGWVIDHRAPEPTRVAAIAETIASVNHIGPYNGYPYQRTG